MSYSGIHFTWAGGRHGVGAVKKSDRVMANMHSLQNFEGLQSKFLLRGVSNRSLAIADLQQSKRKCKRPLKFYNFLAFRDNFLELV